MSAIAGPQPLEQLGITGRDLYRATLPATWAEPDTGWAWARYLGALSFLLDCVAEVSGSFDGYPRWTQLADPARCPPEWLYVLAQWAGVTRSQVDSMTPADLRLLIGPHGPGMWRGTRAAMEAAVRRFYPPEFAGSNHLYFEERAGGNAYALNVFTYSYVQPIDQAALELALQAAKPAGLLLNYQVRQGHAWFMLNQKETSWAAVNAAYATWEAVLTDTPI